MSTSIFIKSFAQDIPFLDLCLRSLRKFAKGFSEIVLVFPDYEESALNGYDLSRVEVLCIPEPRNCNHYIFQQLVKMLCDTYTQADHILHVDSDYFATREFTPDEFFRCGKPRILFRDWKDSESAITWKKSTDEHLGFSTFIETMCAPGIIHPRTTFEFVRAYLEERHGQSLWGWGQNVKECSEYNLLGSLAHRYLPHLYDWTLWNYGKNDYPLPMTQAFSRAPGGVENFRQQYEEILAR